MMQKPVSLIIKTVFVLSLLLSSSGLFGQSSETTKALNFLETRKEAYISFSKQADFKRGKLNELISIDRITQDSVFAYINKDSFRELLKSNITFKTLTPPSLLTDVKMSDGMRFSDNWDTYPTYGEYVSMMQQFANDYPQICMLENLGQSINGRDILAIKISDNVINDETETEFLYTSSMHGDELTGMILTLRLIDNLLSQYGSDQKTTELINTLEIWICPLTNPDGTYFMGNNTVQGATRFNENGVDINRNFPDPENGLHPDGYPWQQETLVLLEFLNTRNFVMSANFHTGFEVVNYPWDTWSTLHADNMWFEMISREYADTVHTYASSLGNYFTAEDNGITNGYNWYTTNGSIQDFMNYFHGSREVTIELSFTKTPVANLLPLYWEANQRSMYNYMSQCLTGFYGIVKDSINQNPIEARIEVMNHDFNNSSSYSESVTGYYHRLIYPGIYDLYITSPGYRDKLIPNVFITDNSILELNIDLFHIPLGITSPDNNITDAFCFPNPVVTDFSLYFNMQKPEEIKVSIIDNNGILIHSIESYNTEKGLNQIQLSLDNYPASVYYIQITSLNTTKSYRVIKIEGRN